MKASPLFVFRNLAPTAGWRRKQRRRRIAAISGRAVHEQR